jgi:hypothetical protein
MISRRDSSFRLAVWNMTSPFRRYSARPGIQIAFGINVGKLGG